MHEGHNAWTARPSSNWQMVYSDIALGMRSNARILFRNSGGGHALPAPVRKGAEGWLDHLDRARCQRTEAVLRAALDFAQTLPFLPKEVWQVAKSLAELTGTGPDKQLFRELDLMRRSGIEALHY
jgi:hypothetical protein